MDIANRYIVHLNDKRLISNHYSVYLRPILNSNKLAPIVSLLPPSYDIYRSHMLDTNRVFIADKKDINFLDDVSHQIYNSYMYTEHISLVNSGIRDPLIDTKKFNVFGLIDTAKLTEVISRMLNFVSTKSQYTLEALDNSHIFRWLVGTRVEGAKARASLQDLDLEGVSVTPIQAKEYTIKNIMKQSL